MTAIWVHSLEKAITRAADITLRDPLVTQRVFYTGTECGPVIRFGPSPKYPKFISVEYHPVKKKDAIFHYLSGFGEIEGYLNLGDGIVSSFCIETNKLYTDNEKEFANLRHFAREAGLDHRIDLLTQDLYSYDEYSGENMVIGTRENPRLVAQKETYPSTIKIAYDWAQKNSLDPVLELSAKKDGLSYNISCFGQGHRTYVICVKSFNPLTLEQIDSFQDTLQDSGINLKGIHYFIRDSYLPN